MNNFQKLFDYSVFGIPNYNCIFDKNCIGVEILLPIQFLYYHYHFCMDYFKDLIPNSGYPVSVRIPVPKTSGFYFTNFGIDKIFFNYYKDIAWNETHSLFHLTFWQPSCFSADLINLRLRQSRSCDLKRCIKSRASNSVRSIYYYFSSSLVEIITNCEKSDIVGVYVGYKHLLISANLRGYINALEISMFFFFLGS